jgi:hypothetical protein
MLIIPHIFPGESREIISLNVCFGAALLNYDWISVPLVYTQAFLLASQYLKEFFFK